MARLLQFIFQITGFSLKTNALLSKMTMLLQETYEGIQEAFSA